MLRITGYTLLVLLGLSLNSCIETVNNFDKLPNGRWRAALILDPQTFTIGEDDEEVYVGVEKLDDSVLPFNFDVSYDADGEMKVTLINGEERINISEIQYGRNNRIAKDSMRFVFPEYDSYIKANYEDNSVSGQFVITSKKDYSIPFQAEFGKGYRFTALKETPLADLTGKWECTFEEGKEDEYKALGEFKQDGNHLTGTFLTETGDYRFLEGTVQGNKAYLSVFDGSHAFLFTMKILDASSVIGTFRSGKHYKSSWSGKKNDAYELTDPSKLTYLNEGAENFTFSFPDSDGQLISLSDERFEGKTKIVTIMGTWCPNCKDEMQFLNGIKAENKDVEVVAIAFERYKDEVKARAGIKRYTDKMDLQFPMLHGGIASKSIASETFPMLNKIISFPTLLILNSKNEVKYIHTGFNGPATSKYEAFIKEFETELASAKKS